MAFTLHFDVSACAHCPYFMPGMWCSADGHAIQPPLPIDDETAASVSPIGDIDAACPINNKT